MGFFSKIDHILVHKARVNKYKKIKNDASDHSGIKETRNKNFRTYTCIGANMLLMIVKTLGKKL